MIDTPATVSVRVDDRSGRRQPGDFNFTYQKRKGVFQSFIRQDPLPLARRPRFQCICSAWRNSLECTERSYGRADQ